MKRYPKKRIFITGAGSGFGRALSLVFAEKGWKIAVGDINESRMAETLEEIRKAGGEGIEIFCDVTKEEDLQKAAALLKEKWGGVDIVVNNAGVAGAGFVEKIPQEQWDWILDLNLKSVITGSRVFIPLLESQGGGHIVNMASAAGYSSLPEMSCYNVTKAGVISLSETMRTELSRKNINVTVITPTFFKTNLMDQFRCTDDRQLKATRKFFAVSRVTARDVATRTYKAIEKNRLYANTQNDGRVIWFLKRLFPETFAGVMKFCYEKGITDRLLN